MAVPIFSNMKQPKRKMASKKRGKGTLWQDEKRIEVATTWLATGSWSLTSAMTGVPIGTLRFWKEADWWKDLLREIQDSENIELSGKLKKIVDKSIDVTIDRLENGDHVYDAKKGKMVRVPVKLRDSVRAIETMQNKRMLLAKQPTKITESRTVDARLEKLAEEFAKFSNMKIVNEEEPAAVENVVEIVDASEEA